MITKKHHGDPALHHNRHAANIHYHRVSRSVVPLSCRPPYTNTLFHALLIGSFVPSSLRPFVPSSLRPVVPSSLRPFVPSTLRPFVPSSLRPVVPSSPRPPVPPSPRPLVPPSLRPVVPSSRRPVVPSSRRPVVPSSRRPVVPSSRRPVVPSSRRPVVPSSRRPVVPSSRRPTYLLLTLIYHNSVFLCIFDGKYKGLGVWLGLVSPFYQCLHYGIWTLTQPRPHSPPRPLLPY